MPMAPINGCSGGFAVLEAPAFVASLDDLGKPAALLVVQDQSPPWSLARRQTIGAALIEPEHSVAHDL
jgi:hypothetical protein